MKPYINLEKHPTFKVCFFASVFGFQYFFQFMCLEPTPTFSYHLSNLDCSPYKLHSLCGIQ